MSNSGLIADALFRTNPALHASIDGSNSWKASLTQRGARVALYRAYEGGDHRADMTTQMRALLRLRTDDTNLTELVDNYCSIVVDKMAGRLSVNEISTGDKSIDENWLEPLLERNDFQAAEGEWWRGSVCDGDSFVMVDPQTFLWSSEPAFDGFSGMVVIYNQMTRKPVWACKCWAESDPGDETENAENTSKIIYLIVYQPDKVTYWKGSENGQTVEPNNTITVNTPVKTVAGDGYLPQVINEKQWPLELEGALPFVSYANNRKNYTRYGDSELRKAIPPQDALNRTFYSMIYAGENAAFPQSWSIGMKIDPLGVTPGAVINLTLNDANGKVITDYTSEQIEFLKACKLGQFSATDITQYTKQLETIVKEISQTTQTPIYGITASGVISGDALKQLEIGLIGKCQRFQRQNTDALKELIILTAKMQRVFSPGSKAPDINTVAVTWKSPELLDIDAQIKTLSQLRKDNPGLWPDLFYRTKTGALLGMSKDEIMRYGEMAYEENEQDLDNLVDESNSGL